jgi:IS5 family transposase
MVRVCYPEFKRCDRKIDEDGQKNQMKILNDLKEQFEDAQWAIDPELALIDTILNKHPELYNGAAEDIVKGNANNDLGRKDGPTVEQVVRAGIYKELKGLDYRGLEYAQADSRICAAFMKLGNREPFSHEVLYKYISKVRSESLMELMIAINRIALREGLEDGEKIRIDTTVVESNIHYPTNNSLIWDCIKESRRLLSKLDEIEKDGEVRDYTKQAKRNYYHINVEKNAEKRKQLFKKQLKILRRSIKQTERVLRRLAEKSKSATKEESKLRQMLEELLPKMEQVHSISIRHELYGEQVPNQEKIYSIYEDHTDIIVKGAREVQFGHKVNLTVGKSALILDCQIVDGNPKDSSLYKDPLLHIQQYYGTIPRDVVTDGGYASLDNLNFAKKQGVLNIVFNKIVGSLKNVATSLNMETRLKKWRSGIEAVISNLKRGFDLFRCEWKGKPHFDAKALWSVIAYNIRVMTGLFLDRI